MPTEDNTIGPILGKQSFFSRSSALLNGNTKLILIILGIILLRSLISHIFMFIYCLIFVGSSMALLSFKLSSVESSNLKSHFETTHSTSDDFPRFKFISEVDWDSRFGSKNELEEEALFPESFLISESLDNIIEYILRDFVKSWFQKISQDETFLKILKEHFKLAVTNLAKRLDKVDISNLIVLKLLPIVNDHFNNFIIAEEIVKSKKKSSNKDLDLTIASCFNKGQLHPAIRLKNLSFENDRKEYLQESVESILPFLISRQELASSPVNILLKNILTSCVLFPSLSMLGDSDFWNQIIVSSIGSVLKDRYQVERFRSVLDRHSSEDFKQSKTDFSKNSLMKKVLNTKTSPQLFDKILKRVDKSQNVLELKQLRYYTGLQLSNSVRLVGKEPTVLDDLKQYNKRLQVLQIKIDERLGNLMNDEVGNPQNKNFKLDSLPKNSKLDFSLNDILTNPTSLTYFMEFMEQRSRTVLLQFWLTINGIRSPLEDLSDYEDLESDDEELIAMSLSLDLSQSEDIDLIFQQFFDSKILKIDAVNYSNVKSFVKMEHKTIDLYVKARKSLLLLQNYTYNRMVKTDFVAFKESDLFLRLLSTEDLFNQDHKSPLFTEKPTSDKEDDDEDEEEDDVDQENVIKAVEDALNDIMINEKDIKSEVPITSRPSMTSLEDSQATHGEESKSESFGSPSKLLHKEIFGDESEPSLFEDMESSMILSNSGVLPKRNSRIFDDLSDSDLEGSESGSNFESDFGTQSRNESTNELQLAAPGDLNLAEEIDVLSKDIERYQKQLMIIDPLLNKAEITNNVAELKILRKSKLGLEREIQLKELQKQQYIVQENDNSLFGKSRVRIQSYLPEKNFIMYIIEVQKLAGDKVTAGWIVPRRFSQFYKLNEYLKSKYPKVQDISFPKRKVVLKFQQTSLIEERKNQLERYLQELLKIPEVCTNQLFRSFLSSEVFAMELNDSLDSSTKMSRRAKVESVANKFYSSLSSRVPLSATTLMYDRSRPIIKTADSSNPVNINDQGVNDMQKELNSFDEVGKISFVQPICDTVISVFNLRKSSAWLRGRAVLVVLQQVLGSTIEKKVRDNLQNLYRSESHILDIIILLRDKLWPEGSFRKSGKPRSTIEKTSTKTKSKIYLEKFIVDSTSKIFGTTSSKFAASKLHAMLQNDYILNNLIFSLYDAILQDVFLEERDNKQ